MEKNIEKISMIFLIKKYVLNKNKMRRFSILFLMFSFHINTAFESKRTYQEDFSYLCKKFNYKSVKKDTIILLKLKFVLIKSKCQTSSPRFKSVF